jgi:hypothetical protein
MYFPTILALAKTNIMQNEKRSQPLDLAPVLYVVAVVLLFVLGNCGPQLPMPH